MSEYSIEIYKALRESQHKYVYFLLASAAAGIGLGLQQTSSAAINISQFPLLIAGLLWGISFYCGCRQIQYINSNLYANMTLIQIEEGQRHELTGDRQKIAASEGIVQAMESNSTVANHFGHWQFRFLIAGAIFYIVWHIFEMYLRDIT